MLFDKNAVFKFNINSNTAFYFIYRKFRREFFEITDFMSLMTGKNEPELPNYFRKSNALTLQLHLMYRMSMDLYTIW